MEEQVRQFQPELAVMMDEKAAADLKVRLADTKTRVASGMDGLVEAAELPSADTVITAVGEHVDTGFYTENGLAVDNRGRAVVNPDTLESSIRHVFVVGDGQKGPGTVVEAIAGATKPSRPSAPSIRRRMWTRT